MWRDDDDRTISRPLDRSREAQERRRLRRRAQERHQKKKTEDWRRTTPGEKQALAEGYRQRRRTEQEGEEEGQRTKDREALRTGNWFQREREKIGRDERARERTRETTQRTEGRRKKRSVFGDSPVRSAYEDAHRERGESDHPGGGEEAARKELRQAYSEFSYKHGEGPVAERPESRRGDRRYYETKAAIEGARARREVRRRYGRGGRRSRKRRGGRTKRRKGRRRRCPKTGKPICYCKPKRKSRRGGRRTRRR